MEKDRREQLLNQFYINNENADVRNGDKRFYANPREMLADLIAGEDISKHGCNGRDMKFQKGYFKPSLFSDSSSSLYKCPPDIITKDNTPFKVFTGPYATSIRGNDDFFYGDVFDGITPEGRETIENNLTYDGYCVLLGMLKDYELINYRDSITKGINNEARSCLLNANSVEEVKSIQENFLQLKAATEYLTDRAEAILESEQFDASDEMISATQEAMQDFK